MKPATVPTEEIARIVNSEHHHPKAILGLHEIEANGKKQFAIRAFQPFADELFVLSNQRTTGPLPMTKLHESGFFEAVVKPPARTFHYRFKAINPNKDEWEFDDPYAFPLQLTEDEKQRFAAGKYYDFYKRFGAHVTEINGVQGVLFIVWAPNAVRVSVVGNFNGWDGRCHQMNMHQPHGIWELFIPGLQPGEPYKFEIKTRFNTLRLKADPVGAFAEHKPPNATIIHGGEPFTWQDADWIKAQEKQRIAERPLAIYEVHLGSWRRKGDEGNRVLTYRELAHELADYVKEMGFTHVELLPVSEHPYDGSWGYQVTGYFAPTSRYGTPDDFKYFVDYLHRHGIGVIIDWVPAHFPRDDYALRLFDGTALYEHEDPRLGEHPDWGTLIFNYGRFEVKNFLISNALYWFDEFHIDGLRVDAVASMLYLDYSRDEGQWIPNKYGGRENLEAIGFMKELNEVVYSRFPHALMIAEESTAWPNVSKPTYIGGLGFGLKWNMGWMNDFLEYMSKDSVHRKYHHNKITFSLWYAFSENFILVLSHDEVVHGKGSLIGKMPGDLWQKFANLRLMYSFMYGHPGKKLLFMGAEIGQWNEWNHKSSLDWHLLQHDSHQQLQRFLRDLNKLYSSNSSLWQIDFDGLGFQWIDFQDADNSLVAFYRRGKKKEDVIVVVCNFTPVPRRHYRIGVPLAGYYHEVLNSDSAYYGGSNVGNLGGLWAEPTPYHGLEHSIALDVPPLAAVFLKPDSSIEAIR